MADDQEKQIQTEELLERLERLEGKGRNTRFWRRLSLLLLVGIVTAPFAADALTDVPHSFSNGGTISASQMNANFAHLVSGITAVENKVVTGTCATGQLSRYDGTSWVCSDDETLTTSDANLTISGGSIELAASPAFTSVDLDVPLRWNNSISNGTTEMSIFAPGGGAACDSTKRGQIRMWEHEDIGNSTDIGDSLCFCQRYIDRTPATPVTSYRWVCLYPQSDGD